MKKSEILWVNPQTAFDSLISSTPWGFNMVLLDNEYSYHSRQPGPDQGCHSLQNIPHKKGNLWGCPHTFVRTITTLAVHQSNHGLIYYKKKDKFKYIYWLFLNAFVWANMIKIFTGWCTPNFYKLYLSASSSTPITFTQTNCYKLDICGIVNQ